MVEVDPSNPFVVAKDNVTGSLHVLAESALIAAEKDRYTVTDQSPYDHNGDLRMSKPHVPKGEAKDHRESKRPAAPSQSTPATAPTTTEEK